jgi:small-conductance mechanosensitive channel
MNDYQKHQSQEIEYQEAAQKVQKLKISGFVLQLGAWGVVSILKYLQVQHLALSTTVLFGILLLSRIRNFTLRHGLDQNMSRLIFAGVKAEKQNPRLGDFFHKILKKFGFLRIVLQRSLLDLGALYFFSLSMSRLILDMSPNFEIKWIFYPLLALLGFFFVDLYCKPFKGLASKKGEAFES